MSSFAQLANEPTPEFLPETKFTFNFADGSQAHVYGRPATDRNEAYLNMVLNRMARIRKQMQKGKLSSEMIKMQRQISRGIYADTVVTKIEGWVDSEGEEIASNKQTIGELMLALTDEQFDDMSDHFGDDESFRVVN